MLIGTIYRLKVLCIIVENDGVRACHGYDTVCLCSTVSKHNYITHSGIKYHKYADKVTHPQTG